jgi:hypothetical protein
MTSQGSAYARFERSLDTGDPGLIVPAALELPRVNVADGVRIVLAIAQSGREGGASWRMTYDGVAVRFGAAVARRLELRLDETLLLFSALHALRSPRPEAAAAALEQLLEDHQEAKAAAVLGAWLRLREGS